MTSCGHIEKDLDTSMNCTLVSKGESSSLCTAQHCFLTYNYFQWVQCDMRYLDLEVLGKFSVIMADPPWDIHMEVSLDTKYAALVLFRTFLFTPQVVPVLGF